MTTTEERGGYVEAAKQLLECKISGASREVCERMSDGDSYQLSNAETARIKSLQDEIEGLEDEISSLQRQIDEIESNPSDAQKQDMREVRTLCLIHGVPLPN